MLNLMREVFAGAVTCTALDDLIRIVHLYGVFGIGVCKYPAFYKQGHIALQGPTIPPGPRVWCDTPRASSDTGWENCASPHQ